MFHIGLIVAANIATSIESERFNQLSSEEKKEELRLREVRALERIAAAADQPKIVTHHHYN